MSKNFAYSCKFTYRTAGFGHRTGLAFLHRLGLAIHLVCVEVGACGMRLVCLLLQLTGLNRFVGTSYGMQPQVNRRLGLSTAYENHAAIFRRVSQGFLRQLSSLTTRSDCIAGVWVIDCASRQAYNVSVIMAPASADNGHGAKQLENLANTYCQDKRAGESMVSPTRPISTITTRSATQADSHFLYTLHKLALGPYVEATWGWDEAFQGKRFRDEWEPTANQIVLLSGVPIGCLRVEDHDDHVFVDYIAIMPEHQRHGIGASLLRQVQVSAAPRGLPVRPNVLKVNPARALYERLGFAIVGEDDVRWYMGSPIGAGAG